MKGLIIKDLLIVKRNFAKILIFMAIFSILFVKKPNLLMFIFPFYSISMCLSTLSYDDYNKWNNYAKTLPLHGKEIVTSKYLMTGIVLLFISFLSLLIGIFFELINNSLNISELLINISVSLISSLITMSFMYPIFIKFGAEKGRIILFVVIFIICGCGGFIVNSIDYFSIEQYLNELGLMGFLIITMLMVVISYFISVIIYKNKED